ncbi:uncharacterized protein family [Actinidia rufa]|uniref:CASP-like protein n=1 Tax=Actinidia rufa TaxID=165716 RepID=A0A7J0E7H5_9ERIC|nr:uncharacterized protein family [Actinidia rufa]
MSSPKDPTKKTANQPAPPPLAGDVESQTVETGFGVAGIRAAVAERGFAEARVVGAERVCVGDSDFLSTVYTGVQALRQVHELSTGKQQIFSQRDLAFVDFFGDQIVAYLLVSAASSAVPITNRMREGTDNIFTDSSAAAISMEFLAFLALAFSALVSGYKLSNQSYV